MGIKNKLALLSRWIHIATGRNLVSIKQGGGRCYSKTEMSGYYNDLTGKVNKKALLDKKGIPLNRIAGGKLVYFPIAVLQYALGLWDKYILERDSHDLEHFLTLCDWILGQQYQDGSWDCFSSIGHSKYTVSSMGQGEAISVLLRGYQATQQDKYRQAADRALTFMLKAVDNGGTLIIENEHCYFEEYPYIGQPRSTVLNGWIFSLFGLYDYIKITNDENIKNILVNSVQTLIECLGEYDTGYWTLYDRGGRLASPAYHDLHISLLSVLADIMDQDSIYPYINRWEQYQRSNSCRTRAVAKKIWQKLRAHDEGVLIQ